MPILGGNNSQGAFPTMFFQVSQTWACPVAMEAIVYVIGAGGSGACVGGYYDQDRNSRGGAAGGCAVSRLSLSAQNYTVTIGSGGDYRSGVGAYNGNAGGASSFSGTGISTMTGNGGAGGTQSTAVQDTTAGGGTATGGNLMNNTGGGGGANPSDATIRVSGGGGVNLYGSNCHGEGNQTVYAMGGSPIGYSTGQYNYSFYDGQGQQYGYGHNADLSVNFFPALIAHQSGVNAAGQGNDLRQGQYGAHAAALALSNFKGGDVKGSYTNGYSLFTQAGPFCGGMGYIRSTANGVATTAQSGGVGAGGGGAQSQTGSGSAVSGTGGSGLIMIFPLDVG